MIIITVIIINGKKYDCDCNYNNKDQWLVMKLELK